MVKGQVLLKPPQAWFKLFPHLYFLPNHSLSLTTDIFFFLHQLCQKCDTLIFQGQTGVIIILSVSSIHFCLRQSASAISPFLLFPLNLFNKTFSSQCLHFPPRLPCVLWPILAFNQSDIILKCPPVVSCVHILSLQ